MPPTSPFFQVSASGELGACEGTQAVLAIPLYRLFCNADKYGILSEKSRYNFYCFLKNNQTFLRKVAIGGTLLFL